MDREVFQSRFVENLLAKKEEAETVLANLMKSRKENGSLFSAESLIEEFDHADREISAQTFYKLIERKNKELDRLNFLLQRVRRDEEFGLCEECGDPIPEERLFIVPDATLCVSCQRELEKLESRLGFSRDAYPSSHWKRDLEWDDKGDAGEDMNFFIATDEEFASFGDLEEIDLNETQESK